MNSPWYGRYHRARQQKNRRMEIIYRKIEQNEIDKKEQKFCVRSYVPQFGSSFEEWDVLILELEEFEDSLSKDSDEDDIYKTDN